MTRALILAAGQGTRLQPLTDERPKCLVSLVGRSLLERQIQTLRQADVDRIHVVTGYHADQIEALGIPTSHNEYFGHTNMVESLFCALEFIEECGDLLIAYGDIVYQQENLEAVLSCTDEIALMIDVDWKKLWSLRLDDPLSDAETLVMDGDGFVIELGRKPDNYGQVQGQYTGLIKIRSDKISDMVQFYQSMDRDLNYDGKTFSNMYMTSFLQQLIDAGWKAKAVLVRNGWLEVDSVNDLLIYERMAEAGTLDEFYRLDP